MTPAEADGVKPTPTEVHDEETEYFLFVREKNKRIAELEAINAELVEELRVAKWRLDAIADCLGEQVTCDGTSPRQAANEIGAVLAGSRRSWKWTKP